MLSFLLPSKGLTKAGLTALKMFSYIQLFLVFYFSIANFTAVVIGTRIDRIMHDHDDRGCFQIKWIDKNEQTYQSVVFHFADMLKWSQVLEVGDRQTATLIIKMATNFL